MEIEIASPNEKEKMQMRQYQAQIAPLAQQQKGMGGQMLDMAKQRAMSSALDAGQGAVTSGIKSALAPTVGSAIEGGAVLGPTAGAGGMAALGTAVPYVGAGLLAGKALGLFNEGGQVGPLSTQYHADGNKIDRNKKYSEDQQIANYREMMKQQAYNKLITGQNPNTNLDSLGAFQAAATSDPIMSKIYDVGKAPRDNIAFKMTPGFDVYTRPDKRGYLAQDTIMNPNSEGQLNPKNYYEQGGQVGMSKQQAMALMNNQPDPDELYKEIVAESMTEAAQQQMPQPKMRPPLMVDPYGADTTYDAEMYKQINT
jgi:hypothetical protein